MRKRLTQSRWSRLIPLAGALALMTTYASAQGSPTRPRGGQHILTPEEKQIDNDYKAATSKIPDQKPKTLGVPFGRRQALLAQRRQPVPAQKRRSNKPGLSRAMRRGRLRRTSPSCRKGAFF